MLEAIASGVPVAAYPVTGPLDVVTQGVGGILDEDLGRAARAALKLDRAKVREEAFRFSWAKTAELFLNNIMGACGYAAAARSPRRAARAPGDHAYSAKTTWVAVSRSRRIHSRGPRGHADDASPPARECQGTIPCAVPATALVSQASTRRAQMAQ
jgi:hypothetical protein